MSIKSPAQITRRQYLKLLLATTAGLLAHRHAQATDRPTPPPPPTPTAHRILSCNILLDLPEHTGDLSWQAKRRDACMAIIKSRNADIICLQEVGKSQNEEFVAAFPDYASFGFHDPASDTNPKRFHAIRNVILYRTARYEMTSQGSYWISKTPLIAGTGLDTKTLPRHVNWVRLRDKSTRKEFRVLNIHWSLEQDQRLETARIINEESNQYPADFPQIIAGDFNAVITSREIKAFLKGNWRDTYTEIEPRPLPTERRKIDFVFIKGPIKTLAAELILDTINGVAPSDHFFVGADIQL